MRVLVTGATGFVGSELVARLVRDGAYQVRCAVRRDTAQVPARAERAFVPDLTPDADWGAALEQVDAVVHLAARVHVMRDTAADPLGEFRRVNVGGTSNLARQAAAAGVTRFVFVSSIKVNGEEGEFTEDDIPAPADAYGISKHEAELALRRIAAERGMPVVIIRPPLVYGPGVKANFRTLVGAVKHGIPLPLGAIDNRRSLIAVDNLVDFIVVCLRHPAAANETFLVSDGEDLSTPELIRRVARALGRPPRLIRVPAGLLTALARMTGRDDMARRLLRSSQIPDGKARRLLGWSPPISVDEGLKRALARL